MKRATCGSCLKRRICWIHRKFGKICHECAQNIKVNIGGQMVPVISFFTKKG